MKVNYSIIKLLILKNLIMKYQRGFSYFNLIIVFLLVIAFVIFFFVNKENQINEQEKADIGTSNNLTNENNEESKENRNTEVIIGGYESYDESSLSFAEKGSVVLFFRASWCPTCRALDKDIETNRVNIPNDLLILDVDYDNSKDLKKKYGVTYQHTLVEVDKNGNLIKKWSGSSTLKELISNL